MTAAIANETGVLQFSGGFRNAFPTHAQHAGDQFLCDDQFMRRDAIEGGQQPAAQLLLHRVVPIAGSGLCHLRDQRLGVAQQQALQQAGAIELLFQKAAFQTVRMAGGFHDG